MAHMTESAFVVQTSSRAVRVCGLCRPGMATALGFSARLPVLVSRTVRQLVRTQDCVGIWA